MCSSDLIFHIRRNLSPSCRPRDSRLCLVRSAPGFILSARPYHSISALTAAFNHHLWPIQCQSSTRSSNRRYWNMVITLAQSWNFVHFLVPMSLDTLNLSLKAFTFDLVAFGCTSAVIKSCWSAIQNRHKKFKYIHPIYASGQYSAWERCIASAMGALNRIRFPVLKTIVHSLLLWRDSGVHTLSFKSQSSFHSTCNNHLLWSLDLVKQLNSKRDFLPDFHTGYDIPGYDGTAPLILRRRKKRE